MKKVFLLFLYPFIPQKDGVFNKIRLNIENYLIFQPSKLRAVKIDRTLLKKFEPIRFITSDRRRLFAWYFKPQNDEKPVILHLHGQAESVLSHQDVAKFCLEKGYGLLLLSYRGHYKSSGKASEAGLRIDVQAAIDKLKEFGIDSKRLVLWGHSLGTVFALYGALDNDVAGVILQSPIKEIKSSAININDFFLRRIHLKMFSIFTSKIIEGMNFISKLNNIESISKVKVPILLLHSKSDVIAPCVNSEALHKVNPNSILNISKTGSHWGISWCVDSVFEFIESLKYN
ncbi:MAG: alpha/beta hydrolase [bacterium]|nr:alpha/beta hydrolase [bacterium]